MPCARSNRLAIIAPWFRSSLTCQVRRIDAPAHKTRKAGIRPVGNALNITVLDRVPMDVIYMLFEIVLIPDLVFPETPLPKAQFAALAARGVDVLLDKLPYLLAYPALDDVPT